jgi:Tfp pilus assembly protein PilX
MKRIAIVDTRPNEKGIALVFTLFLMASLSALAVSLMFLAQTETSSTRNYRTMSQARYAGEAGVHKAINYMINSYVAPDAATFTKYNLGVSPVTCAADCATIGGEVVLSSFLVGEGYPVANYPDSTVSDAFAAAVEGNLATNLAGTTSGLGVGYVTYGAYAKLLSMRQVNVYGGGIEFVQTWEITAVGTVPGTLSATVEVSSMLERDLVEAETFAVFATSDECGAITYSGSAASGTDSYNSTSMTLAMSGSPATLKPVTTTSGGAVGTNGNLNLSGAVTINGSLSTPRSGVGACSSGSVTAYTGPVPSVTEGFIQLPQAKIYPTPVIPAAGADDWDISNSMSEVDCNTKVGPSFWQCHLDTSTNVVTITPMITHPDAPLALANVTLGSNMKLVIGGNGVVGVGSTGPLAPATVKLNFNTFIVAGNTTLTMGTGIPLVELNLTGSGLATGDVVMDFQGNFSTTSWDPSKFQILYAGTNLIKMRGNNDLAATIYAPNANVDLASSYDVWGSILAKKYTNSGGAKVHYDTSLGGKYKTLGNRVMTSFSWKKY